MNRYPAWKYIIVVAAVVLGIIYAVPNLPVFGETPAIQISGTRATKADAVTLARAEDALKRNNLPYIGTLIDETGVKIRFPDIDIQLKAVEVVKKELGDTYTVALNLLPATPAILRALHAEPMHLGLDLRGGVYFLMQVDARAVLKKAAENTADDVRRVLREAKVRYVAVNRQESGAIDVVFRENAERDKGREIGRASCR